jgi:hypothetical protein
MAQKSAGVPKGPPWFLEYSEDHDIQRVNRPEEFMFNGLLINSTIQYMVNRLSTMLYNICSEYH